MCLDAMVVCQHHRGPDATGAWVSESGRAGLGHNRLSIIDTGASGNQPLHGSSDRFTIVFNGEIYNYLELRAELSDYPFRTNTDTEVLLAAFERWGPACLDRLIGMFAFLIWDDLEQRLFGARDRFGVKPLHYAHLGDTLLVASEVQTLHAGGIKKRADSVAWATYLTFGLSDHSDRTYWDGIRSLRAGHSFTWTSAGFEVQCWYDLAERTSKEFDDRPMEEVLTECFDLIEDSIRLRLRSDVPVGLTVSGGLDSSLLLSLAQQILGQSREVRVFTFATGDERYDEVPWVRMALQQSNFPLTVCMVSPKDVVELAHSVQQHEGGPFGGLPTIAYARLFEVTRECGLKVLLDGNGLDEQWAGYDYYFGAAGHPAAASLQGTTQPFLRPESVRKELQELAEPLNVPSPYPDALRNLQYRDARFTKLPRSLRFNDRISMRGSAELREPFLDHRLFELAFQQKESMKCQGNVGKVLIRQLAQHRLPQTLRVAPKRPVQTPQREWLRGPLADWAEGRIEAALSARGGSWLDAASVRREWNRFRSEGSDNSFYVWQWINLGLAVECGFE